MLDRKIAAPLPKSKIDAAADADAMGKANLTNSAQEVASGAISQPQSQIEAESP